MVLKPLTHMTTISIMIVLDPLKLSCWLVPRVGSSIAAAGGRAVGAYGGALRHRHRSGRPGILSPRGRLLLTTRP